MRACVHVQGATVVPIYTQNDENDITIRAYTKCATYVDRLAAWYKSDEFKAKEQVRGGEVEGEVEGLDI